jgi:hypothetical protein
MSGVDEPPVRTWRPPPLSPPRPRRPSPMSVPAVQHDPTYGPPAPLSKQERLDRQRLLERMKHMELELERSREIALSVVGLTEERAVALVHKQGRVIRIVGRDLYTLDLHSNRLSLFLEDGIVVRAEAG